MMEPGHLGKLEKARSTAGNFLHGVDFCYIDINSFIDI